MATQARLNHPLAPFGYRVAPHGLWRLSPRLFMVTQGIIDIGFIVSGRLSLHRAWQAGYDEGTAVGYKLTIGSRLTGAKT